MCQGFQKVISQSAVPFAVAFRAIARRAGSVPFKIDGLGCGTNVPGCHCPVTTAFIFERKFKKSGRPSFWGPYSGGLRPDFVTFSEQILIELGRFSKVKILRAFCCSAPKGPNSDPGHALGWLAVSWVRPAANLVWAEMSSQWGGCKRIDTKKARKGPFPG